MVCKASLVCELWRATVNDEEENGKLVDRATRGDVLGEALHRAERANRIKLIKAPEESEEREREVSQPGRYARKGTPATQTIAARMVEEEVALFDLLVELKGGRSRSELIRSLMIEAAIALFEDPIRLDVLERKHLLEAMDAAGVEHMVAASPGGDNEV